RKSSAKRAAQAVETTRKKHKTLPIGLPFQNSDGHQVEDGGGATEHLHKGAQPTNQAQAVPAGDEVLGGLQRQKEREAKEVGGGQRHHEGSRRLVKLMPRRAALTLVATSAAAVASLGRPADDDGQVAGDAHQEGDQVRAENGQKGEVAAQQVPQVDRLQRVGSVEDRVQEGRATVLTGSDSGGGGGGGGGNGSGGFTVDQISPMLKGQLYSKLIPPAAAAAAAAEGTHGHHECVAGDTRCLHSAHLPSCHKQQNRVGRTGQIDRLATATGTHGQQRSTRSRETSL
ncbi:hypothetical protein TYRP_022885, partial [Tyrophagus putrescentiae]